MWAVGGSDSSGGAGIQADIRTIHNLGVHAGSIVTAVTAQGARGVSGVWPVPLETLAAQWEVLERDLPPAVIKIGMLGTAAHVRFVAERLRNLGVSAVLDPVMGASAGGALLDDDGRYALLHELIPQVSVLTPNLVEASALLGGRSLSTSEEIETAARNLAALGPSTVIIKGGHGEGPLAQDCVLSGDRLVWLSSRRLQSEHTHGTGCTFASAYAVALSRGGSAIDAAVVAKMYVTEAIRNGYAAGQGAGPVQQGRWPQQEIDLPWSTGNAAAGSQRL
ncbi:MAG: bifunctional hydroxymethylpyrimidine kinase/phosphomethylpyrimidine kinase, partial [Thermoanaerobaculia bacterium]